MIQSYLVLKVLLCTPRLEHHPLFRPRTFCPRSHKNAAKVVVWGRISGMPPSMRQEIPRVLNLRVSDLEELQLEELIPVGIKLAYAVSSIA